MTPVSEKRGRLARISFGALILLLYVFLLAPLAAIMLASFTGGELMRVPPQGLSLRWFVAFFQRQDLVDALLMSLRVALVTSVVTSIVGMMAALCSQALSRRLAVVFQISMTLPLLVHELLTSIGLLFFLYQIGLAKTFIGLQIGHILIAFPYAYVSIVAALRQIDPAMEEALVDTPVMRRFAQLGGLDDIPDETTILNFRRLLETHGLAEKLFAQVNAHLQRKGLSLRSGTIVDATIINAPSSTKNQDGERDPEMHQTRKGNQWYFGMKAHIGVDDVSGLVHHVECTAANVADVTQAHKLLHGEEDTVCGDSGYTGAEKREELQDVAAAFLIAEKPSKLRATKNQRERRYAERWERYKASLRAKVEHPFRVIKRQFGYMKVRYRGIAKNAAQVLTLFALSNLWMVRRQLMPATGLVRL